MFCYICIIYEVGTSGIIMTFGDGGEERKKKNRSLKFKACKY
jgi:hypothetical protein